MAAEVPPRHNHVGSIILDEALPHWASEQELLRNAQDTGTWATITKNMNTEIKATSPNQLQLAHMR
eukprot:COSAG02_NODE_46388_length_349_cov_0.820000_1_plen_65_part_10